MTRDAAAPTRTEGRPSVSKILWTIPRLYHRLTDLGERLYGHHGLTSGKRSLLRDLVRRGPHSLAEMIRNRPSVSRQYIQRLVSELRSAGLVALDDNPDDSRSKIVRLTDEGRNLIKKLAPAEERLVEYLAARASPSDLETTARVLASIADQLEDEGLRAELR